MAKNESLINLLNDFQKSSFFVSEEEASVQKITSFITTYPETCFDRTLLVGHVCGSVFVVNSDYSQCLLMHHKKLNMWVQFGGHADGDPDIPAVAAREAFEESGIVGLKFVVPGIFDLDVHDIPATVKEPAHTHYDVRFLMVVPQGAQCVQNDESHELRWCTPEEVKALTSARSMLRMVEKWQELSLF